jgi:cytochrome c-type biogenesis protein CcmE
MTPTRKKRLTIILALVFGSAIAISLTLFALEKNINLFYSTSQITSGEAPKNTRMRIGGMVVKGSVKRATESLQVSFKLTDYATEVTVVFTGILPDLFREGQGIIAQGKLDAQRIFQADEVLAKHDEKYMPPEIAETLKKKTEETP